MRMHCEKKFSITKNDSRNLTAARTPPLLPHLAYFFLVIFVASGINSLIEKREEKEMQEAVLANMGEIYMSNGVQTISTHLIHSHQFSVPPIPRKSLNALSTAADDIEASGCGGGPTCRLFLSMLTGSACSGASWTIQSV